MILKSSLELLYKPQLVKVDKSCCFFFLKKCVSVLRSQLATVTKMHSFILGLSLIFVYARLFYTGTHAGGKGVKVPLRCISAFRILRSEIPMATSIFIQVQTAFKSGLKHCP